MAIDIRLGDCLVELATISDGLIDMVFADPPFNVGKRYGRMKGSDDRKDDYYEWCYRWIQEGFRVLKPTGVFYLMTIARHVFRLGCEMERHGVFVNKVEWRNVSAASAKKQFWPSTQTILIFGKTPDYKFHTYAQVRDIDEKNRRWGGYSTKPRGRLLDYWSDIPFVYSGSIHHKEAILRDGTNKKVHPAQMPVDLASRCIQFATDVGDTVLDIFSGSGTVGVAASQSGRRYIGIEREPEYYDLIIRRLGRNAE